MDECQRSNLWHLWTSFLASVVLLKSGHPHSLSKKDLAAPAWVARTSCVPGNQPQTRYRTRENYNEHSQYVLEPNKLLAVINVSEDTPTKGLRSGANPFIQEKERREWESCHHSLVYAQNQSEVRRLNQAVPAVSAGPSASLVQQMDGCVQWGCPAPRWHYGSFV